MLLYILDWITRISLTEKNRIFAFPQYVVETFSNLSSDIVGSLRVSSEMIGNVEMTFRQLSDNFGAVFVSIWMKFTVTVNFFTVRVKMPKIYLFYVTELKS